MITGAQFKKSIYDILKKKDFTKNNNLMCVLGEDAVVLVGVEKGFGNQWFINIGFCFRSLIQEIPSRIEHSHMYYRLERLFPEHREIILAGSDLDDPEHDMWHSKLLYLLSHEVADGLRNFASVKAITEAYQSDRLNMGLVRKEARDFLSDII